MPISSSVEGFQWNGLIRLIRVAFAVNPLSNFQIANFPGSDIRRNLELVSNLNFQWYYSAPPPLITKPSIYVITTFFVQCKQSLSFVKIIQSTLWQKRMLTYILVIDRSYQEYHILTPKFSFWRSLLSFCNFWVFCGGSLPNQDISILWTTNPIKGGITQKHFQ